MCFSKLVFRSNLIFILMIIKKKKKILESEITREKKNKGDGCMVYLPSWDDGAWNHMLKVKCYCAHDNASRLF